MGATKQTHATLFDTSSVAPKAGDLGLTVRVLAADEARASYIAGELSEALSRYFKLEIEHRSAASTHAASEAHVLFVDARTSGLPELLGTFDRSGQAVFLIVREGDEVPAALVEGLVDDVLVQPFRPLEVLGKLRQYQRVVDDRALREELRQSAELNASYAQVVERLQQNLQLAERMQKSKLPLRFPEVKGFKVTSRYLAGTRSGGDYADLAETRDGQQFAIVLTDASSYRVSGAVLDTVSRVMTRLSTEETRSCITAARRIRDGVLATMTDQDRLSLFYAVMSRKDYRLRFLCLGTTRAFYAPPGKSFRELDIQGDAVVRAQGVRAEVEGEIALEPEGRLVLVSDGFVKAAGGPDALRVLLDRFRAQTAADSLNEMAFLVKGSLSEPDDLPARDCTAVIFDVDSRVIRLA